MILKRETHMNLRAQPNNVDRARVSVARVLSILSRVYSPLITFAAVHHLILL